MEAVINIEPQANICECLIVELIFPAPAEQTTIEKEKSGLVRISTVNHLRRTDERLRKDLKTWMPRRTDLTERSADQLQRIKTVSIEFHDENQCLNEIESYGNIDIIFFVLNHSITNSDFLAKLKELPQSICIYRCVSCESFQKWSKAWSIENQSFIPRTLPQRSFDTPIEDLDQASQLILMEIFLSDMIAIVPNTLEVRKDFINYCSTLFADDPTKLEQLHEFDNTYVAKDAIKWYSKPDSFVFRLVCKTFASCDMTKLFHIRFILHDLYVQLRKLHQEQLQTLFQKNVRVYRGAMMSHVEANHLKAIGEIVVTRNFLSTTLNKDVAWVYAGGGQKQENLVSVLLKMTIERGQIQEKPAAIIENISRIAGEKEALLSMGFVFQIVSLQEMKNNSEYSIKIRFVRGDAERQIERNLQRMVLSGSLSSLPCMISFLASVDHHGQYSHLISQSLQPTSDAITQHHQMGSNNNQASIQKVENNGMQTVKHFPHPSENQVTSSVQQSQNEANHAQTFEAGHEYLTGHTTKLKSLSKVLTVFQTPRTRLFAFLTILVVVSAAIGIPLGIVLSSKTKPGSPSTPAICLYPCASFFKDYGVVTRNEENTE